MDSRTIQQRVLAAMSAGTYYTAAELARITWLGVGVTAAALTVLWQAGKVTTGTEPSSYRLV